MTTKANASRIRYLQCSRTHRSAPALQPAELSSVTYATPLISTRRPQQWRCDLSWTRCFASPEISRSPGTKAMWRPSPPSMGCALKLKQQGTRPFCSQRSVGQGITLAASNAMAFSILDCFRFKSKGCMRRPTTEPRGISPCGIRRTGGQRDVSTRETRSTHGPDDPWTKRQDRHKSDGGHSS